MKTVKLSLAEQLKAEFMERYGLQEDQINLQINIYTPNVELGRQILAENDKYSKVTEYLPDNQTCDNTYGEHVDILWVHKRNHKHDWTDTNE